MGAVSGIRGRGGVRNRGARGAEAEAAVSQQQVRVSRRQIVTPARMDL